MSSYYDHGGTPAPRSFGSSAAIRAEFALIAQGFDKFPDPTTGARLKANAGGTAWEVDSGNYVKVSSGRASTDDGNTALYFGASSVGIGGAPVSGALHVVGDFIRVGTGTYTGFIGSGSQLFAGGGASEFAVRSELGPMTFGYQSAEHMRLNASGQWMLGIKTPSMGALAEVNGVLGLKPAALLSGLIGASTAGDAFYVDAGQTIVVHNYGLSWKQIPGAPEGATAVLSGYGGVRLYTLATQRFMIDDDGNVVLGLGTTASGAAGNLVLSTSSAPSGDPVGAAHLFFDGTSLKFKGPTGGVRTVQMV